MEEIEKFLDLPSVREKFGGRETKGVVDATLSSVPWEGGEGFLAALATVAACHWTEEWVAFDDAIVR